MKEQSFFYILWKVIGIEGTLVQWVRLFFYLKVNLWRWTQKQYSHLKNKPLFTSVLPGIVKKIPLQILQQRQRNTSYIPWRAESWQSSSLPIKIHSIFFLNGQKSRKPHLASLLWLKFGLILQDVSGIKDYTSINSA